MKNVTVIMWIVGGLDVIVMMLMDGKLMVMIVNVMQIKHGNFLGENIKMMVGHGDFDGGD